MRKAELGFAGTALREQLVAAVLLGEKTATAGLLVDYERDGEPLPEVGERLALVDNEGRDVAVLEITEVRGQIKDGKVEHFQVGMKVGFRLEDDE